jgi:diguanylate cyclase (GGDEF)-like protein
MMTVISQVACVLSSGEKFLQQKDYARALDQFEAALARAQRNHDLQAEILALQRLGTVHLMQDQPVLAIASVQQALSIALEQRRPYTLYDCHRQLAQTYRALQDFELALKHFEMAASIREDLLQNQIHPAIQYGYPGLTQAIAADPSTSPATLTLRFCTSLKPAAGGMAKLPTETISEPKAAPSDRQALPVPAPLTQVYDRRHFFELAQRALVEAPHYRRPLTLIRIDIDQFKSISDLYGYRVGDQVLSSVVLRLQNNLRQRDILARYGGEKFVILMPETAQSQGWNGAERLRKIIAQGRIYEGPRMITVTASVGVTSWGPESQAPMPSLEELVTQANQALDRVKRAGHNQTLASSNYPPQEPIYLAKSPSWPDNHAWPTCADADVSGPAVLTDEPAPD